MVSGTATAATIGHPAKLTLMSKAEGFRDSVGLGFYPDGDDDLGGNHFLQKRSPFPKLLKKLKRKLRKIFG